MINHRYVIKASVVRYQSVSKGTVEAWIAPVIISNPKSSGKDPLLFESKLEAHRYAQEHMRNDYVFEFVGYCVETLFFLQEKE